MRKISPAFHLFLTALPILALGCAKTSELEVVYFYASHCSDCGEVEAKLKSMNGRLRQIKAAFRVQPILHNILTDRGFAAFEKALQDYQVGLSSRHAPLMLVGTSWYYGSDIDWALGELEEGRLP